MLRSYNPDSFSCEGQDYGYYADVESGCEVSFVFSKPQRWDCSFFLVLRTNTRTGLIKQVTPAQIFHICLPIQDNDGIVTSTAKYSFFCGNGTVFDQQVTFTV